MNTAKPFVEAGVEVLDLIHDQSHFLVENQRWNIRELMKSLLRKPNISGFLNQVRALTREIPQDPARKPNSCYAKIPGLSGAMFRLRAEVPPPGPAETKEITMMDIELLRGRIEGLIDLFGGTPPPPILEPDESSDADKPLTDGDIQKLIIDVRNRRSTSETPPMSRNFRGQLRRR